MKQKTTHFFVDRRRPAEVEAITPSEIAEAYAELAARQTAVAHLQHNPTAYTERLQRSNNPSAPHQIAATKRTVADDLATVDKLASEVADLPDCPLPAAWVIVYPMPGEPAGKWAAEACVSNEGEHGWPQIRVTEYSSPGDALQALRDVAGQIANAYPATGQIDYHAANRSAAIQPVESGR